MSHPSEVPDVLLEPEHQQRIKRIAIRRTKGTSIAWEDAVQAAYVKIFRSLKNGRFQGGVEELCRWSLTVAKNAIIDFVEKEVHNRHTSLDQKSSETDWSLLDIFPSDINLLDTLERTDLIKQAIAAIYLLDQRFPDRHYWRLWQAQVEGKSQTELAAELQITQSAISKRWKQLLSQVVQELGLYEVIEQSPPLQQRVVRQRSTAQW